MPSRPLLREDQDCCGFVRLPLLMAHVFGYEGSPTAQSKLRRALGQRGGAEGFAAAALSGLVPHGCREDRSPAPLVRCVHQTAALERAVLTENASSSAWEAVKQLVDAGDDPVVVVVPWSNCQKTNDALAERLQELTTGDHDEDEEGGGEGDDADSDVQTPTTSSPPRRVVLEPSLQLRNIKNDGGIRIPDGFLLGSSGVRSLDLTGLTGLTSIEEEFLYESRSITSVTLSGLPALTSVGAFFLCNCPALTSVAFSNLPTLTNIDSYFLCGSSALRSVDLSPLTALTTTHDDFMSGCDSLVSVNFEGLAALTAIGNGCFCDCNNLARVDFSGMAALTSIGDECLRDCMGLQSVNLSGLTALTSIGDDFIVNAENLVSIDMSGVTALASVGDSPFDGAPANLAQLPAAMQKHR